MAGPAGVPAFAVLGTKRAFASTATGIRTRVSAVRGRYPSPLDDGGPAGEFSAGVAAGRGLAYAPRRS